MHFIRLSIRAVFIIYINLNIVLSTFFIHTAKVSLAYEKRIQTILPKSHIAFVFQVMEKHPWYKKYISFIEFCMLLH